ncbi:hypothetical protein CSAL01_08871 [Colletotrichum salicis]|uniref:Uncharacterized protein n=1 Tax=Colletotrichum salicis TaxID=1209931 RepID=A0A135TE37_9PEZI|nr:hypothetical protein CSAL01_08871 [Colletotrichum salicis]
MKRSRPPSSSSDALNYGPDDGRRSRTEDGRDIDAAKRPKTNDVLDGTLSMHPDDERPTQSLSTEHTISGRDFVQFNDDERNMEIRKLEEKLSMLKRSSDRDVQDINQAPYLPAGLDLDNPKLSFYTESQRAPPRHPSRSIDGADWSESRPDHTGSYGHDHRNNTHRDTQRPIAAQLSVQEGGYHQTPSTRSFQGTSSGRYNANRANHTQKKPHDRTSQGEARSAPPHAPVAAAADSRPSQYLSNGGQKRNKVYHDTDIRRHKPPFRGKVKMTSEEWTRNQITTS